MILCIVLKNEMLDYYWLATQSIQPDFWTLHGSIPWYKRKASAWSKRRVKN